MDMEIDLTAVEEYVDEDDGDVVDDNPEDV